MHVLVFCFLSFQVCLFTQKIEARRCHDRIRGENFIWLGKRLHRKQTVKSDGNNLDQPKFSLYMWRLQSSFIVWCGGGWLVTSLSELFLLFLIQTGYKLKSTSTTAAANPVESRLDTIQWIHTILRQFEFFTISSKIDWQKWTYWPARLNICTHPNIGDVYS